MASTGTLNIELPIGVTWEFSRISCIRVWWCCYGNWVRGSLIQLLKKKSIFLCILHKVMLNQLIKSSTVHWTLANLKSCKLNEKILWFHESVTAQHRVFSLFVSKALNWFFFFLRHWSYYIVQSIIVLSGFKLLKRIKTMFNSSSKLNPNYRNLWSILQ